MPIVETGVKEFDAEGVTAGRLAFTTDVASAEKDAETTCEYAENVFSAANNSYVKSAAGICEGVRPSTGDAVLASGSGRPSKWGISHRELVTRCPRGWIQTRNQCSAYVSPRLGP